MEDPNDNNTYSPVLERLNRDFRRIGTTLAELAEATIRDGATGFPVFIATDEPVGLGLPALSADDYNLRYDFKLSLLEELVKKGLVEPDNLEAFKLRYGDPLDRACILLVAEGQAQFVFIDYPLKENL